MTPEKAYEYAKKYGHLDSFRKFACQSSYYAYWYAKYLDKEFHEDTWEAVKGTKYEEEYNKFLNQIEKSKII